METLFHYCSNDAFVSMILQRQIWFSMFSASNDFLEGRVAIQVFEDLCLKDGVLAPHVSELKKAVEHMLEIAPAAGFCLSEAPDQVSQWRGYAREGRGFSVGFDASYLRRLGEHCRDNQTFGFSLQKVIYERDAQVQELREVVSHVSQCVNEGAFRPVGMTILEADEGLEERREQAKRAHRKLYARLLIMMFSLFKLKNPCFAEEKEWRLLSYVTRGPDPQDDMLRLCSFRATERGIVPYIPVKLADLGQRIINEVIIGPANLTPPEHVSAFLVANVIEGVAVRKSQASYR